MALIRPRISVSSGRQNQPIRIPIYDLLVTNPSTLVLQDTNSTVSSLIVKNVSNISSNNFILIGQEGNEGSEIVRVTAVATPSTLTITPATYYPHSSSTPVRVVNYDYVEISTASTLTGTKTAISTPAIAPDSLETIFSGSASTGYYFSRFYNSYLTTYSPYSDGVPVSGYGITTARSIIDNALQMINKTSSEVLSDEYGFMSINNCQMEVLRELKRWSFMEAFDENLGSLTVGTWKVSLPTDIDDTFSNKSIYNFRIGTGTNINWVDKQKWNEITESVAHSTLSTPVALLDTTAYLSDSSDFSDSGTIFILGNDFSYTANNRSTGALTIDSATNTASSGDDVFASFSQGTPNYWTTFGGFLYFYPVLGTTLDGRDGHLDYYKTLTSITSDTDTIVLPDPTIVQYYVAWKFLLKLNSGKEDAASLEMFKLYQDRRERLKSKETMNRTFKLKPRINSLDLDYENQNSKRLRIGNFNNTG